MMLLRWVVVLGAQFSETSSTSTTTEAAVIGEEPPALSDSVSTAIASALDVEVHAFISQGFIKTSTNNYLASSARGSFEFTEVGINFTKSVTDNLRGGIQLFARKLGPTGNYSAKLDWFYLDYRFADWLGIRAGRVKLPFGLYTEASDIDSTRVPILLPQSVYPIANRDFLLSQTGGEAYGYISLQEAGAIEYRLYGGTIFLEIPDNPASPFRVLNLETPYLVGGRLIYETPLSGLRAGGSIQVLRLDSDLVTSTGPVSIQIPATLWVASLEYLRDRLSLAAEYSRWHVETRSSNAMSFPPSKSVSERGYFLASYIVNEYFHPGVYYSVLFPNIEKREGRQGSQQDFALTLRFDLNSFWLVKAEGHYLRGTAGLSASLNDSQPLSRLANDWFLFMLKTTLYF